MQPVVQTFPSILHQQNDSKQIQLIQGDWFGTEKAADFYDDFFDELPIAQGTHHLHILEEHT